MAADDIPDTYELAEALNLPPLPKARPGRPKGAKNRKVTVTEENIAECLRRTLYNVADYLTKLPTKHLVATRGAMQWLEVIDGATKAGVFPKKHQPGKTQKLTLVSNTQNVMIPPPLVEVQDQNPQTPHILADSEGGAGYEGEGGNGADAPSLGYPSEKFFPATETPPDDSQET